MKRWLGIAVESHVAWPTTDTAVQFQGHSIVLRAATETTSQSIDIEFETPLTADTAHILLRRFLSSLAWSARYYVRETDSVSGNQRICFGRGQRMMVLNPRFRTDYLPEPADPKSQLALALYREALGLNSTPYQFLGFFKIINIIHSGGKEQRAWISSTLPKITDHEAAKRLQELGTEAGGDIARYLYESGRCAVAHAFSEPVVDPDRVEDQLRLSSDLPIIRALAEYLIEHELGVKSQGTVWREHLYELEGFRRILGAPIVSKLKAGGTPKAEEFPRLPDLSVRLRDAEPFTSFEKLAPEIIAAHEGCLLVILRSKMASIRLMLTLDLIEERLSFDPTTDVEIRDDGSAQVVIAAIDQTAFMLGVVANGQLEVWQTQPAQLLGRCDPYVPVNIDPRATTRSLEERKKELQQELQRRMGVA